MNLLELQSDPAKFRQSLLIDSDQGPVKFEDVVNDWQKHDFEQLDSGWMKAAGQKVEQKCYSRAWLERPRGHSKSSDVMIMAVWCLFAARRQIKGVVAAADRDQAKLDRDHVERLIRINPWLGSILKVDQWKISNVKTGSQLDVISSDVASSYGLLIDFAVCDEVTIWPKRDLFDSILSASAKRGNCLLLCIGNAGFQDSWQSSVRETIRSDKDWFYSRLDGPCASWIAQDKLDEQERLLPRSAYERLWLNIWSTGAGDAISASDISAAFKDDLAPMTQKKKGFEYVCRLDIGVSRDVIPHSMNAWVCRERSWHVE
jgi:hypothetical protein